MTVKRDLKRRVRLRQVRTGESYVTARRHVIAAGSAATDEGSGPDPEPDPEIEADGTEDTEAGATDGAEADRLTAEFGGDTGRQTRDAGRIADFAAVAGREADRQTADAETGGAAADPATAAGAAEVGAATGTAVPVVELIDVTQRARRFGLMCRVMMHPSLAQRVPSDRVLFRLSNLLVQSADDPQMKVLTQLGLAGHVPRYPPRPSSNYEAMRTFIEQVRAGLGGVFEDGSTFAFHVAGDGGMVPIRCTMHWHAAALMLWALDELPDELADELSTLKDRLTAEPWYRPDPVRQIGDYLASRLVAARSGLRLFVVHAGRRYAITKDEFVIGRSALTVDLTIADPIMSRRHAAVVGSNGVHHLKDLGSTHGIFYKGMQIDHKRIDEGDVFTLGTTDLRFTYLLDACT